MNNIHAHTELQFEGEKMGVKLIAFLNLKTNMYEDPMLIFVKDIGMIYENELECWDNDDFLFDTLYEEILLPWKKDCEIIHTKDFKDLLQYINVNEIDDLIELFEQAIKLKFFIK